MESLFRIQSLFSSKFKQVQVLIPMHKIFPRLMSLCSLSNRDTCLTFSRRCRGRTLTMRGHKGRYIYLQGGIRNTIPIVGIGGGLRKSHGQLTICVMSVVNLMYLFLRINWIRRVSWESSTPAKPQMS